MRKVALMAYMNANLGDDLFLRILCQRYPNVQFYIRGNNNGKCVAHDLKNLKYLEYNDKTNLTLLCKVINQILKHMDIVQYYHFQLLFSFHQYLIKFF